MFWKTVLQQWEATGLHIHHPFMDGFAPMEQTHGRPGDHWIQTCLCQPYCHGRLSAGWPGSKLGVIHVAWHSDTGSAGRGCHPFSGELGAFLGVDLQAALESWREYGDSLCSSKNEAASNWEKELPQASSGNPNLQQGQWGSSHGVWVMAEEQPGVQICFLIKCVAVCDGGQPAWLRAKMIMSVCHRYSAKAAGIMIAQARSPPVCQSSPPPFRSAAWAVAPSSHLTPPFR